MSGKLARLTAALLVLCARQTALADLQAQLAPGADGRTWQLIDVTFPATPGDVEVSAQDARQGGFGPEFARRVPGSAGHVWLPLPLVAPAELTGTGGGTWPVHIVLRQSGAGGVQPGAVLDETRAELALGIGEQGKGKRLASAVPVAGIDNHVRLSEGDILSGPPLLFAGCNFVYLTPDLQRRMTRARAAALMAAGVQLVAPGDGPPGEAGALQEFAWEQATSWAGAEGGRAWITPTIALPPPAVVEPGLGRLHNSGGGGADNLNAVASPWHGRIVLLLLGPTAIVWLVLSRGMFRRRASIAVAAAAGLLAIAGGAILLLRSAPLPIVDVASWREARAGPSASEGVMLQERLGVCESPLGGSLRLEAASGELLLPAASTLKEYRDFRPFRILLTGDAMTLTGTLAARQPFTYECRRVQVIGLLPPFPKDPSGQARLFDALHIKPENAWWLIDGYVRRNPGDAGELFTNWTQAMPWAAGGAAWYEMRYQPGHRYLLANDSGQLQIVDFGLVPEANAPHLP